QLLERLLNILGYDEPPLQPAGFRHAGGRRPRLGRGEPVTPAILRADLDLFPHLDRLKQFRQALPCFLHPDLDHGAPPRSTGLSGQFYETSGDGLNPRSGPSRSRAASWPTGSIRGSSTRSTSRACEVRAWWLGELGRNRSR